MLCEYTGDGTNIPQRLRIVDLGMIQIRLNKVLEQGRCGTYEEGETLATGHGGGLQASIETSFLGGARRIESGLGSGMLSIRAVLNIAWKLKGKLNCIASCRTIFSQTKWWSCAAQHAPWGRIFEGSKPRPGCPSVSLIPTVTWHTKTAT